MSRHRISGRFLSLGLDLLALSPLFQSARSSSKPAALRTRSKHLNISPKAAKSHHFEVPGCHELVFAGHRKWAGAYALSRRALEKLTKSGYENCGLDFRATWRFFDDASPVTGTCFMFQHDSSGTYSQFILYINI